MHAVRLGMTLHLVIPHAFSCGLPEVHGEPGQTTVATQPVPDEAKMQANRKSRPGNLASPTHGTAIRAAPHLTVPRPLPGRASRRRVCGKGAGQKRERCHGRIGEARERLAAPSWVCISAETCPSASSTCAFTPLMPKELVPEKQRTACELRTCTHVCTHLGGIAGARTLFSQFRVTGQESLGAFGLSSRTCNGLPPRWRCRCLPWKGRRSA
jgi:hypothetical protein